MGAVTTSKLSVCLPTDRISPQICGLLRMLLRCLSQDLSTEGFRAPNKYGDFRVSDREY